MVVGGSLVWMACHVSVVAWVSPAQHFMQSASEDACTSVVRMKCPLTSTHKMHLCMITVHTCARSHAHVRTQTHKQSNACTRIMFMPGIKRTLTCVKWAYMIVWGACACVHTCTRTHLHTLTRASTCKCMHARRMHTGPSAEMVCRERSPAASCGLCQHLPCAKLT